MRYISREEVLDEIERISTMFMKQQVPIRTASIASMVFGMCNLQALGIDEEEILQIKQLADMIYREMMKQMEEENNDDTDVMYR